MDLIVNQELNSQTEVSILQEYLNGPIVKKAKVDKGIPTFKI